MTFETSTIDGAITKKERLKEAEANMFRIAIVRHDVLRGSISLGFWVLRTGHFELKHFQLAPYVYSINGGLDKI